MGYTANFRKKIFFHFPPKNQPIYHLNKFSFLALFSILLYHLLTHVRKSKCYQMVLFKNEVIGRLICSFRVKFIGHVCLRHL